MAATMGSSEKLLLMTTLESMVNGEDFLCDLSCLLVLMNYHSTWEQLREVPGHRNK